MLTVAMTMARKRSASSEPPCRRTRACHTEPQADTIFVPDQVLEPALPDDVLRLIVGHLERDKDCNTLYNLSLSCRSLAVPALQELYRWPHDSHQNGNEVLIDRD